MTAIRKRFATLFLKALIGAVGAAALMTLALSIQANAQEAHLVNPALAAVETFEVAQFHENFGLQQQEVPPEILLNLRTALHQETSLPSASPAQGVLTLACEGLSCRHIQANLRLNNVHGPTLWQTRVGSYRLYALDRFWSVEKPPARIATEIISRLADDVALARKIQATSRN
ncbi:MAG: hypothetical protein IPK79_01525 [Vampirovibrionales bacterium]|nr:hypothetical protein [Vampirovibrionales bacterium]